MSADEGPVLSPKGLSSGRPPATSLSEVTPVLAGSGQETDGTLQEGSWSLLNDGLLTELCFRLGTVKHSRCEHSRKLVPSLGLKRLGRRVWYQDTEGSIAAGGGHAQSRSL